MPIKDCGGISEIFFWSTRGQEFLIHPRIGLGWRTTAVCRWMRFVQKTQAITSARYSSQMDLQFDKITQSKCNVRILPLDDLQITIFKLNISSPSHGVLVSQWKYPPTSRLDFWNHLRCDGRSLSHHLLAQSVSLWCCRVVVGEQKKLPSGDHKSTNGWHVSVLGQ